MIYHLHHTFKNEVFVPILAISPNLEFLMDKNKRLVNTSDNILADVRRFERLHILSDDAQEIVKRLYNTDVYSFMRKWYSVLDITSMGFLYMKLQKIDDGYGEDN